MKIGSKLRELRERNNLSVKDAVIELNKFGITISEKTLYGYESGKNSTNADMFLALCQIYNCKNISGEFSDSTNDVLFTNDEWNVIEKYRDLDPYGKETIDIALKRESERVASLREREKLIKELKEKQLSAVELSEESQHQGRIIQYFQRVSAGTGLIINEDGDTEHITIPDIKKYKRVGYAVKVCGNSMEPKYSDGDMLLIEPTCTVDVGEIGIFNVDGQAYVKKRGETELISLNEKYENVKIDNESKCMGRVIDKFIAD